MYCPSCDKSYGAVHSRCPECHSWLKVSAPASSRAKATQASSTASAAGSGVSTLDKETSTWTEPPTDWGADSDDSWSDALPSPSVPASLSSDPAPVSDAGWGGGSSWSGSGPGESWGGTEPAAARPTSLAPSAPSTPPSSGVSSGGGWLGGKTEDDDWGGSSAPARPATPSLGASPPKPTSSESWSGAGAKASGAAAEDGWGGGGLAASPPARSGSGALGADSSDDGWSGVSSAPSLSSGRSVPAPAPGWLGGNDPGLDDESTSAGWLGDSRTPSVNSPANEGKGWLGGDEGASGRGPSMTELVDRAIGEEEADDFVDDSWVDEEVDNGEFDDLGVPEYVAPTPEVGGAFVKMLLVAVLVLLIGGGVMFLGQEKKTPEQIKAEETAKELAFARGSIEKGKEYLAKGQPLLAIGPLEAAIPALKTSGGSQDEVLSTKSTLATALMKTKDFEKAYEHWAGLAKSSPTYKAEATKQMAECSKLLRAKAVAQLSEAAPFAKAGESSSVLQLGESSLKIFERHGGTATQKGKALGVIGRGYFNGKEYGKARQTFKKALAMNPSGGYQADLARIAEATAPVNYYGGGGGYSAPQPAAAPSQPVVVEASLDEGPGYVTASGSGGGGGSRSSSSASSAASVEAPAAPKRTQEIRAYNRPSGNSGGSRGRLGSKGVLNGY